MTEGSCMRGKILYQPDHGQFADVNDLQQEDDRGNLAYVFIK